MKNEDSKTDSQTLLKFEVLFKLKLLIILFVLILEL